MNPVVVVLISLVLLVLIIYLVPKNSEDYVKKCICSSMQAGRDRVCQDKEKVTMAYDKEEATEFTNLPSKGWSRVSPGDVDFPLSQGCDTPGSGWKWFDFDMLAG